jgi:hypothetical protein
MKCTWLGMRCINKNMLLRRPNIHLNLKSMGFSMLQQKSQGKLQARSFVELMQLLREEATTLSKT